MIIKTGEKHGFLIVRLQGEFDMDAAPGFKEKVITEMEAKSLKNLILNLQGVEFIDSTGIGAILGRYRYLESSGGKVLLVGLNERLKRIFNLSGILKLLPVFDTEESAFQKEGR